MLAVTFKGLQTCRQLFASAGFHYPKVSYHLGAIVSFRYDFLSLPWVHATLRLRPVFAVFASLASSTSTQHSHLGIILNSAGHHTNTCSLQMWHHLLKGKQRGFSTVCDLLHRSKEMTSLLFVLCLYCVCVCFVRNVFFVAKYTWFCYYVVPLSIFESSIPKAFGNSPSFFTLHF